MSDRRTVSEIDMTKITPELEKVARAICIENLKATKQPTDDGTVDSYWQSFILEARAALEAIREPSEGMMHSMGNAIASPFAILLWKATLDQWNAVDHATERYVPIQEQNIIDGYIAAIDHILGKETGG